MRTVEGIRLNRAQLRAVDRMALERYAIPGIVLMENAARQAAAVIDELPGRARRALVVCGGGNNGGDGLAVARHLHNRRWDVAVFSTINADDYKGEALVNWRIVTAMAGSCERFRVVDGDAIAAVAGFREGVIVDAVFGTGLDKPAREPFRKLAAAIEDRRVREVAVVAMDLPSGMDCDTGKALGACVRADVTVTFVAAKAGFAIPGANELTGRVVVADIGAPPELIDLVMEQVRS